LFAPALLLEPQLLAVALAIASALLVAVEMARVGNVPVLGPRVHAFMTAFIDSRDAGAVLVSHFSLLAGASLSRMCRRLGVRQAGFYWARGLARTPSRLRLRAHGTPLGLTQCDSC